MHGNTFIIMVVATIALAGMQSCGKDSGESAVEATAAITPELMSQTLSRIQTTEPLCKSNAQVAAGSAALTRAASAVPVAVAAVSTDVSGEGSYAGNCTDAPGALSITQASHEHGVTTLSVVFNNYCTAAADGGKTLLNGNASYVEHGEPSDAGPIVSTRTGATDGGGLRMTRLSADGATVSDKTVILEGYKLTYGTPYNYFYGRVQPGEAAPNVTEVKRLQITDNLNNIVTEVSDLKVRGYETAPGSDLTDHVIAVEKGAVSIGESGTASVVTEDGAPLVVNANHQVVSGTVTLTGASGSATVTATSGNAASIQVNGAPLVDGTALDCSGFSFDELFFG